MAHRLKAGNEALAGLDDRSDLSKKLPQILQDYWSPSPPHPDQPKRWKKGTCPTWSNWAQNIISFFHLDLRFIDMSNDILFIILFFSLWPECHFILHFWKRINDRVAFTQASIYQTLASGFKTNLQAADQTTPQTLPQVPLAPQVEGKIPSCLG